MSRQYDPNRRRRKPGRPPPNRYRNKQAGGYTGNGLDAYWSTLMPELRGKEKKRFFNRASVGLPVALACGGAMVGFNTAGVLGALVGAGMGLIGGCRMAEKNRFFRR